MERLFGFQHVDNPETLGMTAHCRRCWLAPLISGCWADSARSPARNRSSCGGATGPGWPSCPLLLAPILLGAFWTILGVGILSLLCYREYARATGLFREKVISLVVTLGILTMTFAVLDNWYGLFVAVPPFTSA